MTIEWLRDLVIIITGITWILLLIAVIVVIILIYRKVKPIIDSVKSVSEKVQDIVDRVQEVAKPFIFITNLVRGCRGGAESAAKEYKNRKGDRK